MSFGFDLKFKILSFKSEFNLKLKTYIIYVMLRMNSLDLGLNR